MKIVFFALALTMMPFTAVAEEVSNDPTLGEHRRVIALSADAFVEHTGQRAAGFCWELAHEHWQCSRIANPTEEQKIVMRLMAFYDDDEPHVQLSTGCFVPDGACDATFWFKNQEEQLVKAVGFDGYEGPMALSGLQHSETSWIRAGQP